MAPNPYAQQRRLGRALRELRSSRGLDAAAVAKRARVSPSVVSRLESPDIGRRPAILTVRRLLDALEVPRGGADFQRVDAYAEAAAMPGWWDESPYSRMGSGQRDIATLESGAAEIREYAGLYLPGLVQTEAYARYRAGDDPNAGLTVAGRMERQRQIEGVPYRLLLEEQAIRRGPRDVMREQLAHLLTLIELPHVGVRLLPVDADLGDGLAPHAPWAHMTYPETDDPEIVAIDQVRQIHLVTDVVEIEGYARLHERLRTAALSDADTAAAIRKVADSLA